MKNHTKNQGLASAFGAAAMLVALLVGVPIALWAMSGSPIPSSLPSISEILNGLTRGPISDAAIVEAIAIVGWLAWVAIAGSIVLEIGAWIGGRTAPRLAFAGPIQPAVRRLIATAALLLSSPTFSSAAIAATPIPVVLVEHPLPAPVATAMARSVVVMDTTSAVVSTTAPKVHVVQRRDTLWGLAETHLGDPLRWTEVFDLNQGQPQPEGRSLQDPNLIVVGWTLQFPDDAVGLDAAPPPVDEEPADHDEASSEVPEPPQPTDTSGPAPTMPIAPSTTPTTTAPIATSPPATTSPTLEPATPNNPDVAPVQTERGSDRTLIELVGGGLLAASLVIAIDRLRRVRTRQRKRSATKPLSDQLQATELKLRHGADLEGATRLDLSLRALASGLQQRDADNATIIAVRLDAGDLEVLLDKPTDLALEGFESTGDSRGWRLRSGVDDAELRRLANSATAPLPSLVTIGLADGDPLLIDIETAGVLTIGGPEDQSLPYLRRIATELATSTWTDHLDLVTVGEPLGDISGSQRVRHFATADEAVRHIELIAQSTGDQLDSAGHTSTVRARIADDHGDGWIPTILISSEPLGDSHMTMLTETIRPGRGVGAVLPGPIPITGWHALLDGHALHLLPHNLELVTVSLDADTASDIDQILTDLTVDQPSDAEVVELRESAADDLMSIFDDSTIEMDVTLHETAPVQEAPAEVEFRVLGSVDVIGIAPITRRKSMEIATYLALHAPDGVTDDRIKMVFWPDEVPVQRTFNTTMSMTRSALGSDSDGELFLPHFATSGQRFRLTDKVTTDIARFMERAEFAKRQPSSEARPLLEEALRMVRGQPFDVGRGYEWAFAEGFVARASIAVAEAAHRLATLALDEGDTSQAEWAANQGLLAAPGDEALYRDRMLAAKQAGNTPAIKLIMNELCEAVEANEPYDQLDPDTVALFESLTGKSARALNTGRNRN